MGRTMAGEKFAFVKSKRGAGAGFLFEQGPGGGENQTLSGNSWVGNTEKERRRL